MKAGKGCWTCKERRVQCDRGLPTCQKCSRLKLSCKGYGLRLSWPRDDDKRRAISATLSPIGVSGRSAGHLFLHTTSWDIQLYHQLSQRRIIQPTYSVTPTLNFLRTAQPRAQHMELVRYFHDSAHHSLVTFTSNMSHIRDLLLRMALAHDTTSAAALYYALLAVSSLNRHGLHAEALQFKVAALSALSTSANSRALSLTEVAQHVATCMLLCAFEIQLSSEGSGEWLWYIRGAANMIKEARLEEHSDQTDIGALVHWVYYHDAVSRFTMHHWRHKSVTGGVPDAANHGPEGVQPPPLVKPKPASRSPSPAYAILQSLAETCDTLLDPMDPRSREDEYRERLRALEERVETLPAMSAKSADTIELDADPVAVNLYQMATLIYLNRATEGVWGQSTKLQPLLDKGFTIPARASYCDHFFPLFILACEAQTDQQRVDILDLIDRTEKVSHVRSMKGLKAGIQSVWVQRDLHADGEPMANYLPLLSTAVSSSNTLPSYV